MPPLFESLDQALERHRRRHASTGLGFAFADSIRFMNADAWDAVTASASVFLSRAYLGAMETAKIAGFSHRYALVFQNQRPVAAVAAQIFDIQATHLIAKEEGRKLHESLIKGFGGRALICGNLFSCGPHGVAFVDGVDKTLLWSAVAEALYRIRQAERLNGNADLIMVKDMEDASSMDMEELKTFSYRPLKTEPNMVVDLNPEWTGFDGYLSKLTSKYRKSVLSTIKDVETAGGTLEHISDIEPVAERLDTLYGNVWSKNPVRIGRLPRSFFPELARTLGPDRFRCTVLKKEGQIVGFVTNIKDGDTAVGYYIGVDYEANATMPVYFRLLYSVLETAVEWRCKRVSLGRTALEVKARLGGKPKPTSVWIRHRIPFMNVVIRNLLDFVPHAEAPDRSPFKEEK